MPDGTKYSEKTIESLHAYIHMYVGGNGTDMGDMGEFVRISSDK